jgi:hypothetical protein
VGAQQYAGSDSQKRGAFARGAAAALDFLEDIRMKKVAVALAMLAACSARVSAKDEQVVLSEEVRALMVQLMTDTKVKAVTEFEGPAADYQSDGDPMTLEIVMLSKQADGPSRVSDDGEIIFMQPKTKSKKQQTLFTTAFYRKAQLRLGEPASASRE